MDTREIRQALKQAKRLWQPRSEPPDGFYAIYLKPGRTLPNLGLPAERLLYVGTSGSLHRLRDHFDPAGGDSTVSPLRQALGAVLRSELDLVAHPGLRTRRIFRPKPPFRFDREGEAKLSAWMRDSLESVSVPFAGDACAAGWMLVSALEPALNLSGWNNPQANYIRRQQRTCTRHARSLTAHRAEAA